MLEPAALAKPVITGPHLQNFVEISRAMLAAGAAMQVADVDALVTDVKALIKDPDTGVVMGEAGRQLVADNRGALDKLLRWLRPYLG
jgi:3-deoxy-D-manno-octulosonic-acid transferase